MVSDPAAVLRIAPREHLSRLTCRFALRMRPLRIEFDHVSVGLAGERRFDAPRHLIGRGEQGAIGDVCLARSHAQHRMTKQSGDRQLEKPHFGRPQRRGCAAHGPKKPRCRRMSVPR